MGKVLTLISNVVHHSLFHSVLTLETLVGKVPTLISNVVHHSLSLGLEALCDR